MPQYKVKHRGEIKTVTHDSPKPTKAELRAILESDIPDKPTFGYPELPVPKAPNPSQFYQKDWLEKLDPHVRDYTRPDRSMFSIDQNKIADIGSRLPESIRRPGTMGLSAVSTAAELFSDPESVLVPSLFRKLNHPVSASSINAPAATGAKVPTSLLPPAEHAYNANPMVRQNRLGNLISDETGAVGKNIRHDKRGDISSRFIKKNTPIEPDTFDVESATPYVEPEKIDYVKQMLDSLKLADEQKRLAGLSPKKKK